MATVDLYLQEMTLIGKMFNAANTRMFSQTLFMKQLRNISGLLLFQLPVISNLYSPWQVEGYLSGIIQQHIIQSGQKLIQSPVIRYYQQHIGFVVAVFIQVT
jgi:hypothetical protein